MCRSTLGLATMLHGAPVFFYCAKGKCFCFRAFVSAGGMRVEDKGGQEMACDVKGIY